MIKIIIHHGNNNYKRKYSSCGARVSDTDSVNPEKVNCIACIRKILQRQKNRSNKTSIWEDRIQKLKETI